RTSEKNRRLLFDVVRVDAVLVPENQLSLADDRMRPGRGVARLEREAAALAIRRGIRLGQADHAALAVEIEHAISVNQRALAHASIAPDHLPGVEIERGQDAAREAVQRVAD